MPSASSTGRCFTFCKRNQSDSWKAIFFSLYDWFKHILPTCDQWQTCEKKVSNNKSCSTHIPSLRISSGVSAQDFPSVVYCYWVAGKRYSTVPQGTVTIRIRVDNKILEYLLEGTVLLVSRHLFFIFFIGFYQGWFLIVRGPRLIPMGGASLSYIAMNN